MLHVWFQTSDGEQYESHYSCPDDPSPQPTPGPTTADILRAFKQIPLPASTLTIQPPGGATLVNFDTNFYTHATPFRRTLTLLGHRLRFTITPTRYTWHFDDPHEPRTKTTTHPGNPYPHLDITHRYTTRGTATPRVDTTWTATYRLDDRPPTPLNDTITITGTPQPLTIKTATPLLTG